MAKMIETLDPNEAEAVMGSGDRRRFSASVHKSGIAVVCLNHARPTDRSNESAREPK
jgi:hypothetical protein